MVNREEKVLAVCCHLAYLPIITVASVPLVIWLWKKDESEHLAGHAWQAFVYQGTLTGALIVLSLIGYGLKNLASPLALPVIVGVAVLFGLFLTVVLMVPTVIAASKAASGEPYDYPVLGILAHRLL